jgi:hypothetical protein
LLGVRGIFARVSDQKNLCRDVGANCRKLPAFVDIAGEMKIVILPPRGGILIF